MNLAKANTRTSKPLRVVAGKPFANRFDKIFLVAFLVNFLHYRGSFPAPLFRNTGK